MEEKQKRSHVMVGYQKMIVDVRNWKRNEKICDFENFKKIIHS